jgi:hypothetical protein
MKRTKITSAIVALAIAAVLGTSAHAQVAGYNEGDLLLGFEQQNGSGGVTSNDYVVDLGSASTFIGASTLTFNLSTANLISAFGTNWANNTPAGSLVQWGVVGGSDANGPITLGSQTLQENTLFYTLGEKNVGTKATAPATASNSFQGNINGNIQQFALDYQGTNPGVTGSIIASNDSIGWSANTPSTNAFGSNKAIEQPSSGSYTGPTNSQLDLYQLNNTTDTPSSTKGVYLGDFSLSSGGVLTFNGAAAVPEPSAYAMGVIAAALFFVLRRRKALAVQ